MTREVCATTCWRRRYILRKAARALCTSLLGEAQTGERRLKRVSRFSRPLQLFVSMRRRGRHRPPSEEDAAIGPLRNERWRPRTVCFGPSQPEKWPSLRTVFLSFPFSADEAASPSRDRHYYPQRICRGCARFPGSLNAIGTARAVQRLRSICLHFARCASRSRSGCARCWRSMTRRRRGVYLDFVPPDHRSASKPSGPIRFDLLTILIFVLPPRCPCDKFPRNNIVLVGGRRSWSYF